MGGGVSAGGVVSTRCCWQDTRAAAVRVRIAMVFITDTDWFDFFDHLTMRLSTSLRILNFS